MCDEHGQVSGVKLLISLSCHMPLLRESGLSTTLNRTVSVVTNLPSSTLIFNFLTICVRQKCATTFPTATFFIIIIYIFHILNNTK